MIPGIGELEFKHDGSIQMATEASVMILKHPLKKKKKITSLLGVRPQWKRRALTLVNNSVVNDGILSW